MKNQWTTIAKRVKKIQPTKNKILNEKLVALLKKYTPTGRVFDYGCGWGEWADYLTNMGYKVDAFDNSPEMIDRAQKKFAKPHFFKSSEFKKTLPKLQGKFEGVTSNLVLCILPEQEQRILITNAKRLLKTGGTIYLTFCHPCFDYHNQGILKKKIKLSRQKVRYDTNFKYHKTIQENGIKFDDYHRPLSYYFELFRKHKLWIITSIESDTLGTYRFPDFITFALKK